MKAPLLKAWDNVRSSSWFLPALMAIGAIGLAFAAVAVDERLEDDWAGEWMQRLAYAGGPEGASDVLSTIAGSMINITGVVFSMTLVALSLASSQLGPRLLGNFMRNKPNQIALGTFISTFIYCLLVLRTIRHQGEGAIVPHLSVSLGVVFALASLGVLIYFIHHVAVSIQADEVVTRVGNDLLQGIDRLYPEHIGQQPADPQVQRPDRFDADADTISANSDGYLQRIDPAQLMRLAVQDNLLLRLERQPGHYVVSGRPLVRVWPPGKINDPMLRKIHTAIVLGHQRTAAQDIEFMLKQLVEIAVRALSPSMNDPFTAITCIDRLGSGLYRLAQRDMPSPYRFDDQQQLRIIAEPIAFPRLLDVAFGSIRQNARANAAVQVRLLDTLALLVQVAARPGDQTALLHHADMVVRGAHENLPELADRQTAEAHYLAIHRALHTPAEESSPDDS